MLVPLACSELIFIIIFIACEVYVFHLPCQIRGMDAEQFKRRFIKYFLVCVSKNKTLSHESPCEDLKK